MNTERKIYINNDLEIKPLYVNLYNESFKSSILTSDPIIGYADNEYYVNVYWNAQSSGFMLYDTYLLITYKGAKGKPISPMSFSSYDSYGNDRLENLVEVPFARYNMEDGSWTSVAQLSPGR